MENKISDFSKPSRQSSVAIGIILIKFIKITVRTFWPVLISFFIGRKTGGLNFESVIGYVAIGIAALNLGGSIMTYFRFYFHIEKNAIVIDKGILKRSKVNIPFERIQTINFKQNILHQIFNVVSLEIDTAGAKKSEISIDALKKEDAVALRDYIISEKELLTNDNPEAAEIENENLLEENILHLSPLDLIKVGISQNHLRSMAIIFAFVFSAFNESNELLSDFIADKFEQYESAMVNNALLPILLLVITVLIISFLFSLVNSILKFYELNLSINKKGLKLIRGLLNREEITISKNKIQIISWSTNPLRKMFSMFTMKISQASSTESSKKSNITVPGSYQHQIDKILNTVFSEAQPDLEPEQKLSKLLKIRLFLFFGIVPLIVAGTIAYSNGLELQALLLLAIPVLSWALIELYYKKRSFQLNNEFLKNNSGIFGRAHELSQIHKIQAVRIKQSLYQKRKKLATVLLFTAAGQLKIPFIELDTANQLENFILYRVESDKREWM
jgi:putative membrane protein